MNSTEITAEAAPATLDIVRNRAARKYTSRELAARIAWSFGRILFRFSPRPLFGWRAWLLRRFGAHVGRNVHIYPTVRIEYPWLLTIGDFSAVGDSARLYSLGPISIGARTTISQEAHLCAGSHDYTSVAMDLLKPPIVVGDDVWICADAFVGPSVTIGNGVVVGARAAVFQDVEPWTVVGGNPARLIKRRTLRGSEAHAD
jgi:putative colanic acid biosynthesis acetyltransferase WcaF